MGQATRGGFYCERCDKPVAAKKQTHGVRNASAVLFALPTMGGSIAAGKLEGWHCPDCGGKVVSDTGLEGWARRRDRLKRQNEANLLAYKQHKAAKETKVAEQKRHSDAQIPEPADDGYAVTITALPRPDKKPSAWANVGVGAQVRKHVKLCTGQKPTTLEVQEELEDLPWTTGPLFTRAQSLAFRKALTDAGADVEIISPDSAGGSHADVAEDFTGKLEVLAHLLSAYQEQKAAKESKEARASEGAKAVGPAKPFDAEAAEEFTEKMKALVELFETGLITQNEFDGKKAELLSRL